jgi:hypothetical protein
MKLKKSLVNLVYLWLSSASNDFLKKKAIMKIARFLYLFFIFKNYIFTLAFWQIFTGKTKGSGFLGPLFFLKNFLM